MPNPRRNRTSGSCRGLCCFLLLASACAAAARAQTLSLGVRGGPSLTGVLWEDPYAADGMGVRRTFHVGSVLMIGLSRWLDIEIDALWSRKGQTDRGGAHIGSVESDYLGFPVLARLHLPSRLSPHLLLGPTGAVQLRCWVNGVADVGAGGCDDPFLGMGRARLDWGVILGLGLSYRVGPGSLVVDVLGDLGLRDIKQGALPPGFARNIAIHLSLGFTVPLRAARRPDR